MQNVKQLNNVAGELTIAGNMKIPIFLVFLLIGIEAELILAPDDYEIDPKDAFFRQFRSYDFEHDQELIDPIDVENIPKPGGFQSVENERLKRAYHVLPSPGLTSHFKIYTGENNKYKRTRRDVVRKEDPIEEVATSSENLEEIITTTPKGVQPTNHPTIQPTNQDVIINDFIRFKRNPEKNEEPKGDQQSRSKREPEIRTEKMVMDRDFNEPGTDREPRGATKEQWIKQPYPVERPVDDNVPSASDNIRAPRVHFVTQRRPGQNNAGALPDQRQTVTQPPNNPPPPPPPPPFHRMHDEREGRARDFDRFGPPPQPYYPPYPRPRSYEPYRPRYYDPYYERFDDRRYPFEGGYDSRYKYDDRERDGRPMMPPMPPPPPPPPGNKQRRIIYYATLPEVVRNPSQNNDRYRYRYDGYDDRLPALAPGSMPVGPPPPAGGAQTDRYGRKPYSNQLQKQRDYDRATADRKKTPLYPVKVATDVNVREPKKNPERRIYSDVERRYNNYKPPSFQTAEDGNF